MTTTSPTNQLLTVVGAFPDAFLTADLPIGTTLIHMQILWSQISPGDGGIQAGFSCIPAPTFMRFATPIDRTAHTNGQTIPTLGEIGERLLFIYGTVTVAVPSVLTLIRGQAQVSVNPTTLMAGSYLATALSPITPFAGGTVNVRLFGVTGTVQLPSVHQRQWQSDSVQALMYPYQWKQRLQTTGAIPVLSIRNPDPLVRALRVEIQDGSVIRFEITPPGANEPRLATVESPRLSGTNNLAYGPNMMFSAIDASAVDA